MLNDEEKKVCQQLGVSEEEYSSARNLELLHAVNQQLGLNGTERLIAEKMGIELDAAIQGKKKEALIRKASEPLTAEEIAACNALGVTPGEYWGARVAEAKNAKVEE